MRSVYDLDGWRQNWHRSSLGDGLVGNISRYLYENDSHVPMDSQASESGPARDKAFYKRRVGVTVADASTE